MEDVTAYQAEVALEVEGERIVLAMMLA